MSMSPSLSRPGRVGGDPIDRLVIQVSAQGGDLALIAHQRAILVRIFDEYRDAWMQTNDVVLGGIFNQNMRATESMIQEIDLRIIRLIEVQGSFRQERMNDDEIPF